MRVQEDNPLGRCEDGVLAGGVHFLTGHRDASVGLRRSDTAQHGLKENSVVLRVADDDVGGIGGHQLFSGQRENHRLNF